MDELVIDDKKYLSTKRAAKVTGYAKDYVGQLCREGRVPARLIGRSWYVLESALQDHRFGDPQNGVEEPGAAAGAVTGQSDVLPPTWQPVKYEADTQGDAIPRLQRATEQQEAHDVSHISAGQDTPVEVLNDAWSAWFERQGAHRVMADEGRAEELVAQTTEEPEAASPTQRDEEDAVPLHRVAEATVSHASDEDAEREQGNQDEAPVAVPIHTVRAAAEERGTVKEPERLEPTLARWTDNGARREKGRRHAQRHHRILVAGLAIVAAGFVVLAALGSGYLDSITNSSGVAGALSGITTINK